MEIEIKGIDSLLKKLNKLENSLEESTKKALLKGGAILEAAAKEHCPVDTGQLRESIHTEPKDGNTVSVGTNVEHAIYVEYGTGSKGDSSVLHTTKEYWRYKDANGKWHTSHGQQPQPFMRSAFAESKNKVMDAVKESIKEDVKNFG